jgi:hypothetical protein
MFQAPTARPKGNALGLHRKPIGVAVKSLKSLEIRISDLEAGETID